MSDKFSQEANNFQESTYRVQDGCWNCSYRIHEVGPDGSACLRCSLSTKCSTSTETRGNFVQEAGICPKWTASVPADNGTLRTNEVWI
jgi:hypothetical protein